MRMVLSELLRCFFVGNYDKSVFAFLDWGVFETTTVSCVGGIGKRTTYKYALSNKKGFTARDRIILYAKYGVHTMTTLRLKQNGRQHI